MVDIIKFLPYMPTAFPSNINNLRSKPVFEQINLPICVSKSSDISQNDRINNIQTKRWIGNCPVNPPRLLDVANTPYSIHRKVMYQELSRPCPLIVDLSRSEKSKQQRNISKDTTKITTIGNEKTNIASQSSFSYGDMQNSRLFETLSKPVTVKAEPLRSTNSFTNSTTSTITSWQRYWTSTHAQRRRKEANDPKAVLHRLKGEEPTPSQTQLVVPRHSTYPYSELQQADIQRPSTPRTSNIPTKQNNSSPIPDKQISSPTPDQQISSTKDDNTNKATNQFSTIEFIASSLIASSIGMNASAIPLKTSTIIPSKPTDKDDEKYFTDKDDEKYLTDKSLLLSPSSYFRTDSQIIDDVSQAQIQSQPIIAKVYKCLLPSAKPKTRKKSPTTKKKRTKSAEKKQTKPSFASKQKRPTQVSTNTKLGLASIIAKTSISKYSKVKWSEPYVGLRFDPPTPPSSPSIFTWLQDNDQEDNNA